jgi:nucleoside 2-deoxyribosyltransferase-like protein
MEYFEAPQVIRTDKPSVFLAGGIGNCPDWQATATEMFADLDVAVLNPRRPSFPTPWTREQSEVQIRWEFYAISAANVVLFWFPAAPSMQPIALFELGSHLRSGKRICVGRDPGYLRADDIDIQVDLVIPGFTVHDSLEATVKSARNLLDYF